MKKTLIYTLAFFLTLGCFFCYFEPNLQTTATATYTEPSTDFRAAWVSYYTGDVSYRNEQDYKEQINNILDNLEYYHMNAMIFHVRANHDAWYNSKINKINSQLSNVNFEEFDPLEYVITEAHKRGIEFHAWLNPYRIGSTYETVSEITSAFSGYPNNPASVAENVLIGNPLQILNPAIPEVREFIIDTCMEIVDNYDVDAIHFDDYFYADGIDDSAAVAKYNVDNLSISDFRRQQVDTFIYNLKQSLDAFNRENNRYVQLGISPTGVYKNANSSTEAATPLSNYEYNENGDLVYPIGATTGCQMHYESYLYCDTLKWVNNEWINYILPQTYWATSHSRAPYERLINWWNMAVKYKNVNLYTGMGIYMWTSQSGEALKQLQISSNLEYVRGTSLYSYSQIKTALNSPSSDAAKQMDDIKNNAWKNLTILPEIAGMDKVRLGSVNNLSIYNNMLTWDKLEGAKFYVIYASEGMITYHNDEIVAVVGGDTDVISWKNPLDGEFVYDVVPLSYTNTLGDPTVKAVEEKDSPIHAQIYFNDNPSTLLELSKAYNIPLGNNATIVLPSDAPAVNNNEYNWYSSNSDVAMVNELGVISTYHSGTTEITGVLKTNMEMYCHFYVNVYEGNMNETQFTVQFVNYDGTILKEEQVKFGCSITPPTNVMKESDEKYTYHFVGWDTLYSNILSDLTIKAVYHAKIRYYTVTFLNFDETIFATQQVPYGSLAQAPADNPTMEDTIEYRYYFNHWENMDQIITQDTTIKAIYDIYDQYYSLRFYTNGGSSLISRGYYHYEDIYDLRPTKEGYTFKGWALKGTTEVFDFTKPIASSIELYPLYEKIVEKVTITYYTDDAIYKMIEINQGDYIEAEEGPTKEGYTFKGWALKGTTEVFDFTKPIASSIELYPIYERVNEMVPPSSTPEKNCKCNHSSLVITFICCISTIVILFIKRKND